MTKPMDSRQKALEIKVSQVKACLGNIKSHLNFLKTSEHYSVDYQAHCLDHLEKTYNYLNELTALTEKPALSETTSLDVLKREAHIKLTGRDDWNVGNAMAQECATIRNVIDYLASRNLLVSAKPEIEGLDEALEIEELQGKEWALASTEYSKKYHEMPLKTIRRAAKLYQGGE